MENINLNETPNTPHISFRTDGHLTLQGRSFPKKVREVFDPLIDFVSNLHETPYVNFDINLDYINSASTKRILELLQAIERNSSIEKIQVNWFFEEGDEDSVEIAETYEETLHRTRFTYNEYAEV